MPAGTDASTESNGGDAVQKAAAENVKRIVRFDADAIGWTDVRLSQSSYAIFDFQEMKTVWHPIGM